MYNTQEIEALKILCKRDWDELQAFRATGMTPEQIKTMQAENRALRFDQDDDMAPMPLISSDTPTVDDFWDEK